MLNPRLGYALRATVGAAIALRAVAGVAGSHSGYEGSAVSATQRLGATVRSMAALLPEKAERVAKKKAPEAQQPVNLKLHEIEVVSEEEIARLTTSEWDPEPVLTDPTMDSSCCRALLLEIMRRAAYDWVLYRTSSKLQDKKLAEDAYYWLFEEDDTCPSWQDRIDEDKLMTAFIVICDALDLDPDNVRKHIRKLTIKNVMSVGRPAERRKQPVEEMGGDEHYVHNIDVNELPSFDPTFGGGMGPDVRGLG